MKSSAMIGGSSAFNIGLGIVRTKVVALLIGTSGVGLSGTFSSVTTLIGGIAGMGINTSGVRQIAEAVGSGDRDRISRTGRVLRRTSLALGLAGMLVLLILCGPISQLTFGSGGYAVALAALSVTILFAEISAAQSALIQGMRRIRDLATLSILGAILGTLASLPLLYFFRREGIVPSLIATSALTIATSWWYARKIELVPAALPAAVVRQEAGRLLGMGVVFMASGVMTSGAAYLIRVMIVRQMGLDAAGLYQAAWNLSGVYVGFVLGAMGADYYPRLTAVADDNVEVNRLVNEQAEASLLMAIPGVLGTIAFSPWIVHLLYSAQFAPAVDILRWQILGVLGRVICWPVGFVLLAKGRASAFFWTELTSNLIYIGLVWAGMQLYGLRGLGMAFFGLYLFFAVLIFVVVNRRSGFRWTIHNVRLGVLSLAATAAVFLMTGTWPGVGGTIAGGTLALIAGVLALRQLGRKMGLHSIRDGLDAIRARRSRTVADALS